MRKQILKSSRRLVGRRTYTASELVRKLGIHRQTLRLWRKSGLVPTYFESHPWLYLGLTVKAFLQKQGTARRCKLGPDEFYCLFCKGPRRALAGSLHEILTGKKLSLGKLAVMRLGLCETCGRKMRRAGSIEPDKVSSETGAR